MSLRQRDGPFGGPKNRDETKVAVLAARMRAWRSSGIKIGISCGALSILGIPVALAIPLGGIAENVLGLVEGIAIVSTSLCFVAVVALHVVIVAFES